MAAKDAAVHRIEMMGLICISFSQLVNSAWCEKKKARSPLFCRCHLHPGTVEDRPPQNALHFFISLRTPAWIHCRGLAASHLGIIGIHSEVCSVLHKLCSSSKRVYSQKPQVMSGGVWVLFFGSPQLIAHPLPLIQLWPASCERR